MQVCQCGHSIGVHYHTNNLASCAKCGPKKCQKFKQLNKLPELPAHNGFPCVPFHELKSSQKA